jgi:hypothetical protein
MSINGRVTCAVDGCTTPIWGPNNLCDYHRLPGGIVRGSMIVTIWSVEHEGEVGVIYLNDWALGHHFGGRAGFEDQLRKQGFRNIRNLSSFEEMQGAKTTPQAKKIGNWSGPWLTEYPWSDAAEE